MIVVALASSSSSSRSSLLSSSNKVVFQRRRHRNRARHKIDRDSIASVSRSWTSRTSVSVPLRDHLDPNNEDTKYSKKSSFSEYISDGSRILAVTFPDETRREQMTDTTWKVQLLPFDFVGNRVTVRATIALIPNREQKTLSIRAEKLEFDGMPKEFNLDETVRLTMEGTLGEDVETHYLEPPALESGGVDDDGSSAARRRIIKSTARGDVVMTLDASVNDFVALVPGLDDIVNGINDAVLANLRGAVETNLIAEYERWRERQGDDVNDDKNKENENASSEVQQRHTHRESSRREDTETTPTKIPIILGGNGAPVGVVPTRVARF